MKGAVQRLADDENEVFSSIIPSDLFRIRVSF